MMPNNYPIDSPMNKESEKNFLDLQAMVFEASMLTQVKEDFSAAERFLSGWHRDCVKMSKRYHNAREYESLREKNEFPIPLIQKQIDSFVADVLDKLFYNNEPCTFVAREDTDRGNAQAKQEMMAYQDDVDKIYSKMSLAIRDAALYNCCISQVDYREKTRLEWREVPSPVYAQDESGNLFVDDDGQPIIQYDQNGEPLTNGMRWVREEVVSYRGAVTHRVDPINFFITQDKVDIDDEFPIMVRSNQSLSFFRENDYFINVHELDEIKDISGKTNENAAAKKRHLGYDVNSTKNKRNLEYVEWQGMVNKGDLYHWLSQTRKEYQELIEAKLYAYSYKDAGGELIRRIIDISNKYESCWCIAGVVNGTHLVRLDVHPFDGPNVCIGFVTPEEEGIVGMGLAEKIKAVHDAQQHLMGMLLENLKQTVNAQWIMDTSKLDGGTPIVNQPGGIIGVNANGTPLSEIVKRVEPQRVSPDIHVLLEYTDEYGKDASGIQSPITGKGDRDSETLGEFSQVMSQASLRMRNYLKSFEDSYIKPLYRLRNDINSLYIDSDYAYRIIGNAAGEWKTIEPQTIRSNVDIVCQSSTRETQRAILIQQILQLAKIAPLALSAGQPVRMDQLGAKLCEVGFNWDKETIYKVWPLLKIEEEGGEDLVNDLLAKNAVLAQYMMQLNMMQQMGGNIIGGQMGGPMMGGPGQNISQPTNETEALKGLNQRNQTNLRRTEPI